MATKKVAKKPATNPQPFVFIEAQKTYNMLLSYRIDELRRLGSLDWDISKDNAKKLWELAKIPLEG